MERGQLMFLFVIILPISKYCLSMCHSHPYKEYTLLIFSKLPNVVQQPPPLNLCGMNRPVFLFQDSHWKSVKQWPHKHNGFFTFATTERGTICIFFKGSKTIWQ